MQTIRDIPGEAWQLLSAGFIAHLVRYLIIAGGAYLIFYLLLRRWLRRRKIQTPFPGFPQMRREVLFSLSSFAIFAASGLLTVTFQRAGWGKIYLHSDAFGWGYFLFSIILLIFIHDTWFYWTHRFMHWPPIFRVVHRVHHLSHNPTPWAAFSFHPLEAAIHAIMFPLVVLVLPMHVLVAGIWLLYMTIMNVGGHLGFEILPRGFARHPLFGWHNTAVHHDMHHHHVRCNYSLYFNVWDRLMGTNHHRYVAEHDRITGRDADTPTPSPSPQPTRREATPTRSTLALGACLLTLLAACADGSSQPAPTDESRAGAAQTQPEAVQPRLQVPDNRLEILLQQRTTTAIPGSEGRVTLTIDDITRGQVMTTVRAEDEGIIAGPQSLSLGDVLTFTLDEQHYTLRLDTLNNELVGQDTAAFVLEEGPADQENDAHQPEADEGGEELSEQEKIEFLIAWIADLEDATFIRNGEPHDAEEAAEHLRRKWRRAGDRITTAEQFIEHIASRSSLTGEPYKIRLANGREIEAGDYLSRLLKTTQ